MENNTFEEIWNKIEESNNILLTLHTCPDGDSLGSCTAMKYVLKKLNKKVTLISHDDLSEALQNMDLTKEVEFGKDITDLNLNDFDIFIAIDMGTQEMIGKFKPNYQLPKTLYTINIDHHKTNPFYGNLNYIDPSQPSACSILIDFFKEKNIEFDKELSTRLLIGLSTDSGFFTFDNSEKALTQASFLIQKGGKYFDEVAKPILHKQPLNLAKYYSLLVMKLKFNTEKKYAYATVTKEEIKKLNLNLADVRLGSNHLQYLKEFDFVFTLVEVDNLVKGSFRSHGDVDVSLFASELGGGGHKSAAAFRLEKISLDQAEKVVIEAINKVGIHKTP